MLSRLSSVAVLCATMEIDATMMVLAIRLLAAVSGIAALLTGRVYVAASFTRKPEDYGPLYALLKRNVFDDGPGLHALAFWLGSFYMMFATVELAAAAFFGDFEVTVIVAVISLFNCATAYARLHVLDQSLYNKAAATKTSNFQYILGALGLALVAGVLTLTRVS
eukprot:g1732.t1